MRNVVITFMVLLAVTTLIGGVAYCGRETPRRPPQVTSGCRLFEVTLATRNRWYGPRNSKKVYRECATTSATAQYKANRDCERKLSGDYGKDSCKTTDVDDKQDACPRSRCGWGT